jgi:hypothetical protein
MTLLRTKYYSLSTKYYSTFRQKQKGMLGSSHRFSPIRPRSLLSRLRACRGARHTSDGRLTIHYVSKETYYSVKRDLLTSDGRLTIHYVAVSMLSS